MNPHVMAANPHRSKTKLLDATHNVVRAKGYNATRVEDICAAAGVTKGSFFHHFDSKDDLALAAIERWNSSAFGMFESAQYNQVVDPLDRLLAYVDFRRSMMTGALVSYTCFGGMLIQEAYATHPEFLPALEAGFAEHGASLAGMAAEAMAKYRSVPGWTADGLARHILGVLQGAFIMAKLYGTGEAGAESLDHLRRYIELLFDRTQPPKRTRTRSKES